MFISQLFFIISSITLLIKGSSGLALSPETIFSDRGPLILEQTTARETLAEAAQHARQLVFESNLLNLNTIDKDSIPVSQVEYYADCRDDSADLTLIRLNISTAYRNIARGSPATVSIRTGDKSPDGKQPASPASKPRLTLYGHFYKVFDRAEMVKSARCMLNEHPDSIAWVPGSHIHDGDWVKFTIDKIYYVGGFGNVAYIGFIPVDLYREASPEITENLQV